MMLVPLKLAAFTPEGRLFTEAESRYQSREYALAYEIYDDFVKEFPLSDLVPDAQYRKAVCLFRLGRYTESQKLFDTVERRFRATQYIDYVPFWNGVIFFQLEDYWNARQSLERFLEDVDDPDLTPQALLYKALSELLMGDDSDAQTTMNGLIAERGSSGLDPYEAVLYGYVLLRTHEYERLIDFRQGIALQGFPDVWREKFLLYTAEAYRAKGETEQAREIYKALLESGVGTSSVSYQRLYSSAYRRKDLSEMERLIRSAEEKFRADPHVLKDLWLRIGVLSFQQGEVELAHYFLNKIMSIENRDEIPEEAPLYLSEVLVQKGERRSAEAVLEEYLRRSERGSALVQLRLGTLRLESKEYEKASEEFLRFIAGHSGTKEAIEARYRLAYSLYKMGNLDDALNQCDILLENDQDHTLTLKVMRLKAVLLAKQGRLSEAETVLSEYVRFASDDIRARLDRIKLLFSLNRQNEVVAHSGLLMQDVPDLNVKDRYAFSLLHYMRGLSLISLKSYKEAFVSLDVLNEQTLTAAGLTQIVPYTEYYKGWALYRMNRVSDAAELFEAFVDRYQNHELFSNALYNAAWCYFSMGRFEKSSELFSRLAKKNLGELSVRALFLQGKSLKNLKQRKEAVELFLNLYKQHPDSQYADDTLYEYAHILEETGRIDEAAQQYLRLFQNHSRSPLAEEALYKCGEIYFNNGQFEKAGSAFQRYRDHFPYGRLVDASYYWEASSVQRLGDERRARELWETLIETHEESHFRPDAMMKTAEIYVNSGEYSHALNLYSSLIQSYPEYAEAVNAELRREEVRYRLLGLGKREAELTARISRKGGVSSPEGQKAMNELSRLYIFEMEDKREQAFQMLNQVLNQGNPQTAAEAQLLLGEYYYREGDLLNAAQAFIKASLENPKDPENMAYSIYRAAQMMKLSGRLREVKELVARLESNFPASEWTRRGKNLLEENR